VPVILSTCAYYETEFAQIQAFNDPEHTLDTLDPDKRALVWSGLYRWKRLQNLLEYALPSLDTRNTYAKAGLSYGNTKSYWLL
jgi:hypothetical protein